MKELNFLSIENNQLEGTLPGTIGNLRNLQSLFANHNNLTGIETNICRSKEHQIPSTRFKSIFRRVSSISMGLDGLEVLDMSENKLSTMGAGYVSANPFLKVLKLTNNGLTGGFPTALKSCTNLVLLGLSQNKFSGEIPAWIADKLPSLAVLRMRSNLFHGAVPPQLSRLQSLYDLDLAENNLSGKIPNELGSIINMKKESQLQSNKDSNLYKFFWELSKHHNFSAAIPVKWKGQTNYIPLKSGYLANMDLSSNNLTGSIPEEITNLSGLLVLNLANNCLDGAIPATIGKMQQLESLDLSMNHLTGKIPQSLGSLNFLEWLNLSYNNLSGPIPNSPQLQTLDDPSIYTGNSGLCGFPLIQKCSNGVSEDNHGNDARKLDYDFWILLCSSIVGFMLGFWSFMGSLVLKKSWRFQFLTFVDTIQFRCIRRSAF